MTLREFKLGEASVGKALSFNTKIENNDITKPNILKFGTTQNSAYTIGDEIKYYDLEENYIFGGFLQQISDSSSIQFLEVADYSIKAYQIKINEVYESELIEDILSDLVATYTDWTLDTNLVTGITINKIIFRDEWLSDAINKILEIVGAVFTIDKNKNVKFFIEGTLNSTKDILFSRDILDGGWSVDSSTKAERVIVRGAIIDQRTTETLTGTGTVFYTSYIPENVEISGLQQTTSTLAGDYEVDSINKKITFNSSKTDPSVSYTYKSQVRVEVGDDDGKAVLLEKKYIETRSEARKIAREYLAKYSEGSISSKWIKNDSDFESYIVGGSISVVDELNSKTGTYQIESISLELPSKLKINIGTSEADLFDQNKETIERIKQLEQANQNSDFITLDEYFQLNLNVSLTYELTELKGVINDGTILWASETELDSDADLISDEESVDPDYIISQEDGFNLTQEDTFEIWVESGIPGEVIVYAIAYDDSAIPIGNIIDYLV